AHAIIHRAYHALPDFTSSSGEPTGALYGLSNMLVRIIDELKPDVLIACYDLPQKTHRHDVYDGYKATRKKGDDALIMQLQSSRNVFAAFKIPIIDCPGFEADDILGTIVHQSRNNKGIEIIIASGDMDTMQLIEGERVKVFTLRKGIQDTVLYDEEAVIHRFGFTPKQIPDYKGFAGDASDNIPGIKGIGEKTATELIQKFGGVSEVYTALKKDTDALVKSGFKARISGLVAAGEEDAQFSKMLATIRNDAPIQCDLSVQYTFEALIPSVIALCERYEFRSLISRLRNRKSNAGEVVEAPVTPEEHISSDLRRELAIMVWLLRSEITEATTADIQTMTKTESLTESYSVLKALIAARNLQRVLETIEVPLIPIVDAMNLHGVVLDVEYLKKLSDEYHHELDLISAKIHQAAGVTFNINSPKQLGDVLYDTLAIKPIGRAKTASGARSTKESDLQKIIDVHPIIRMVLEYRELQKLLSTYIDTLPTLCDSTGRLHSTFQQTGTTTGRISSINPNLQNIPIKTELGKRIRSAFVAPPGKVLLSLDYAQIELRIAAILSGDPLLTKAFMGGVDVHTAVASDVFGVTHDAVTSDMRRKAKVINFGILYGMGVNALRQNLGDTVSQKEARSYLDAYFEKYSTLARWIDSTKADAKRLGYTTTLFGRRRYFEGFTSPLPFIRAAAERMAVNAPIQGTQADIIKRAMIDADVYIKQEKLSEKVVLVLQVHDELVYEVDEHIAPQVAEKIKSLMESVLTKKETNNVPIVAAYAIGKNWGALK
ncbi:MAG: polymerase polymerase protein, partial [Candidatus Parcubacteria bacterium]